MESPYGGYDLLFDPFTATVGSQVTERSVYLNVEYDKTDMYVDGYVSDSPDDTDLSSDGILGRSVFIAKNAPFFVPEEQEKVGDSLIRRGTWGWLDFGGPKLDSYVPATDSTTSKSLDWTVPQTDNRRPCEPHLMEVKGFASEGAVDYLSTDNVLVRRVDSAGNRELKYVSLSSLSGGGGCSCEMRQVLTAGTLIAQFTNDGQNWMDIYCLSSGGGGSSTRLSGNTDDSVWIDGDICIEAGLSSNVSAWTVVENGVKKLRLAAYYL